VHFPLEKLCPAVRPLVIPHTVHIFGSEQVASFQLCPLGSPSVAPQEQVFGVVQVAELKLCVCGGSVVGAVVGAVVGSIVGAVVGLVVGAVVGSIVGAVVGLVVGVVVVSIVGAVVGLVADALVGCVAASVNFVALVVSIEFVSAVDVVLLPTVHAHKAKHNASTKNRENTLFIVDASFFIKSAQRSLRTKNAASSCCDTVHSYKQAMTTKHTFLHKKYACS